MVNLEVAPSEEVRIQKPDIFVFGDPYGGEEGLAALLGGEVKERGCEKLLELGDMYKDEEFLKIGRGSIFVIGKFGPPLSDIQREKIISNIVDFIKSYGGRILPFSERREDNLFLLYSLRGVAKKEGVPLSEICITENIPHIPYVAV